MFSMLRTNARIPPMTFSIGIRRTTLKIFHGGNGTKAMQWVMPSSMVASSLETHRCHHHRWCHLSRRKTATVAKEYGGALPSSAAMDGT